jgi:hypothetical protein
MIVHPNLYQTTYIYDGRLYRGVAINEFIVKKGYLLLEKLRVKKYRKEKL